MILIKICFHFIIIELLKEESQKCFQDLKIPLNLYVFRSSKEFDHLHTQQTNVWSKSTIEALEKDVYMFKVNNNDTRKTSLTSFWCLYSQL